MKSNVIAQLCSYANLVFFCFWYTGFLRCQLVHVLLDNIQQFIKIPLRRYSAHLCVPMPCVETLFMTT